MSYCVPQDVCSIDVVGATKGTKGALVEHMSELVGSRLSWLRIGHPDPERGCRGSGLRRAGAHRQLPCSAMA